MDKNIIRYSMLFVVIAVIVILITVLELQKSHLGDFDIETVDVDLSEGRVIDKAEKYETAKEITTPDGFINVDSIALEELIGEKVILIDFWTYSCINCQRTTPYLNAWYDAYADHGLEIVGIHTPEFEFEKEHENVAQAVEQFGIEFPVVLDNDFSTWQAYKNRYWPRKYLIDIDGFIVYDHIGEGAYDETEEVIRDLLEERAQVLGESNPNLSDASTVQTVEVDFSQVNSPEIYFGAERNEHFKNGMQDVVGPQSLTYPDQEKRNELYLSGDWQIEPEFASASEGAAFTFLFDAKNMYTVASGSGTIRVYLDGEDVGTIDINSESLYPLAEYDGYGKHTVEVVIESGDVQFYTLTFG